jgi:hypothetical protein
MCASSSASGSPGRSGQAYRRWLHPTSGRWPGVRSRTWTQSAADGNADRPTSAELQRTLRPSGGLRQSSAYCCSPAEAACAGQLAGGLGSRGHKRRPGADTGRSSVPVAAQGAHARDCGRTLRQRCDRTADGRTGRRDHGLRCIAVPRRIDPIPRDGALVPHRSERVSVDDLGHWALRWPGVTRSRQLGASLDDSVAQLPCINGPAACSYLTEVGTRLPLQRQVLGRAPRCWRRCCAPTGLG